jgi:cytochrome c oxidase subunit 2
MTRAILTHLTSFLIIVSAASLTRTAEGKVEVRKIEIHAKRFAFVPAEITLQKGQPTTVELISDDVPHSLRVRDLNLSLRTATGKPAETVVTAEQTGDFRGTCGVFCGSGHGKMALVVHVVDAK